jgi:hypothetical protein
MTDHSGIEATGVFHGSPFSAAFTAHFPTVQVEWILLTSNECASPFG